MQSFAAMQPHKLTHRQELVTVDNDVKTKFNQYNSVKTNLATLQRRQT